MSFSVAPLAGGSSFHVDSYREDRAAHAAMGLGGRAGLQLVSKERRARLDDPRVEDPATSTRVVEGAAQSNVGQARGGMGAGANGLWS